MRCRSIPRVSSSRRGRSRQWIWRQTPRIGSVVFTRKRQSSAPPAGQGPCASGLLFLAAIAGSCDFLARAFSLPVFCTRRGFQRLSLAACPSMSLLTSPILDRRREPCACLRHNRARHLAREQWPRLRSRSGLAWRLISARLHGGLSSEH